MNNMTKIIAMSVAVASGTSMASAAVISFTDLGVADALGALQADGSGTDLAVSRAASTGGFTYSVTYTGADFDGVGGNDTLTFDVVVTGYNGSTYSYSATPGASSMTALGSTVGIDTSKSSWSSIAGSNPDRFLAGQTLEFSVSNLSVTGTTSGYVATLDSFDGFRVKEDASSNHRGVIGIENSLNSYHTDGSADFNGLSETPVLYITSASTSNNGRYGIENVDFNIEVVSSVAVPEPSSTALIGLGGLALILRRRK